MVICSFRSARCWKCSDKTNPPHDSFDHAGGLFKSDGLPKSPYAVCFFRLRMDASPTNPAPIKNIEPGSGTVGPTTTANVPENVFVQDPETQPWLILLSAMPEMKFWMSIGARVKLVVYKPFQLEIGVVPSLTVPVATSDTAVVVAEVLVKRNGPVPFTEQLAKSAIPAVQAVVLAGPSAVRSKLMVPRPPPTPLKTMKPFPGVLEKTRSLMVPVSPGAMLPPPANVT